VLLCPLAAIKGHPGMSDTGLTVSGVNEPLIRYDVTVTGDPIHYEFNLVKRQQAEYWKPLASWTRHVLTVWSLLIRTLRG
jgi:hypothetical protein